MALYILFLVLAAVCVVWAVTSALLITQALARRGIKTPFPFVGALLFRNLGLYRKETLRGTGRVGPAFYSYVVSINLVWILILAAWATRLLWN